MVLLGIVVDPNNRGTVYPSYPSSSGSYGRYGGYSDAAIQNGVNDGYEKGLEDARKNRSFDPLRHDWYRSGDRHYDSRYGSRSVYGSITRTSDTAGQVVHCMNRYAASRFCEG